MATVSSPADADNTLVVEENDGSDKADDDDNCKGASAANGDECSVATVRAANVSTGVFFARRKVSSLPVPWSHQTTNSPLFFSPSFVAETGGHAHFSVFFLTFF